jgi:hypothetical protein
VGHLRREGEVKEEKQWAGAPLTGGPSGWAVAGAGMPTTRVWGRGTPAPGGLAGLREWAEDGGEALGHERGAWRGGGGGGRQYPREGAGPGWLRGGRRFVGRASTLG